MNLTVIQASGSKLEVSVPDTVAASRIASKLAELWRLPLVGPDGRSLVYVFEHERSGRQIGDDETLVEAGVQEDDVVRLIGREAPHAASSPVRSRNRPGMLALAVMLATVLLGAGAGAVLATGALSGGRRRHAPPTHTKVAVSGAQTEASSSSAGIAASEQPADRRAIMALLDAYQKDYSAHAATQLSELFTPDVSRHGLAAGGCVVSHGLAAVRADYESQFAEGSGTYRLVALSEGQIQFSGGVQAAVETHYRIVPGGSGYVNFRFAKQGEGWKIDEIYATCQ